MMHRAPRRTGFSFIVAILLHVIVLGVILSSVGLAYVSKHKATTVTAEPKPDVVKAVAIDQQAVETQMAAMKAREKSAHDAKIAWQQHLDDLASKAKNQRLDEEAKLKTLNADYQQKEVLKQQAIQNLTRLKALQTQAKMRLADLQKHQDQLTAKNQAVENKLQATRDALSKTQTASKKQVLQSQLANEQVQQSNIAKQQLQNQISRYKTLILNDIGQRWILPQGLAKGLSCQLALSLDPNGKVLDVKLVRSSGNPVLDRSAITAVLKASPLPVPTESLLKNQFKQITLTVKPEGLIGSL
jgi:colicin import membrane protein